eukprot:CAMPEP_0113935362 /NCGR_PEP_ID=MMETSP1339-20121228/2525_1 /TAXON_ID=94617 /ORGANISM="Fibrocapsa japonica" /LENGTH=124 /DNA_ID=CAMNT_0000937485 /DNA_START=49 /DNA_END=423 /DNA_ORIENTATION=- /assembly_acc=CAM_ASM_000762
MGSLPDDIVQSAIERVKSSGRRLKEGTLELVKSLLSKGHAGEKATMQGNTEALGQKITTLAAQIKVPIRLEEKVELVKPLLLNGHDGEKASLQSSTGALEQKVLSQSKKRKYEEEEDWTPEDDN